MGTYIVILIVIFISIIVYKSSQNKDDSPVILTHLDTDDDSDDEIDDMEDIDYQPSMRVKGWKQPTPKEKWEIDFYGGDEFDRFTGKKIDRGDWEGYQKHFRKNICSSVNIITDQELIDIHQNYENPVHPISWKDTRLTEVNDLKRIIKRDFIESLKSKYDKSSKSWTDFDVSGVFMRLRGQMIVQNNPFPHYVWNVVVGNPFNPFYIICRDYTKSKGTLRSSQVLFDNVCKWENGKIFREGEPDKEFETPLWINWNKKGKDFLSLKTKLKKDSPEGVGWLKDTVGGYIDSRKEFYDKFGVESDLYIQDELLQKHDELKV